MESLRNILETFSPTFFQPTYFHSACNGFDPTHDLAPVGNEDLVERLLAVVDGLRGVDLLPLLPWERLRRHW